MSFLPHFLKHFLEITFAKNNIPKRKKSFSHYPNTKILLSKVSKPKDKILFRAQTKRKFPLDARYEPLSCTNHEDRHKVLDGIAFPFQVPIQSMNIRRTQKRNALLRLRMDLVKNIKDSYFAPRKSCFLLACKMSLSSNLNNADFQKFLFLLT